MHTFDTLTDSANTKRPVVIGAENSTSSVSVSGARLCVSNASIHRRDQWHSVRDHSQSEAEITPALSYGEGLQIIQLLSVSVSFTTYHQSTYSAPLW